MRCLNKENIFLYLGIGLCCRFYLLVVEKLKKQDVMEHLACEFSYKEVFCLLSFFLPKIHNSSKNKGD